MYPAKRGLFVGAYARMFYPFYTDSLPISQTKKEPAMPAPIYSPDN